MVNIQLMRHAESGFNALVADAKKTSESEEEAQLKIQKCRENRSLCNVYLTEKGFQEAKNATEILKKYPNVKYAGVSPLRRTIQTLESVFEGYKDLIDSSQVQVKIFRNAHEALLSAGEISFWNQEMKDTIKYPEQYDLEYYTENLTWFEEIQSDKLRAELNNEYGDITDQSEKVDITQKFLAKHGMPDGWEDYFSIRERSERLRKDLVSYVKENNIQDNELILVAHGRILRTFVCTEFDAQTGYPVEGKDKYFANAEIFEYQLNCD